MKKKLKTMKLRSMKPEERVDELFVTIGSEMMKGINSGEISPYHDTFIIPDDTTVVVLDKWKGKLAKKIAGMI
jgi:hypothetical protein